MRYRCTETTGLDTDTDDIIQIAAVRVKQGKMVGEPFNLLLETDKELPATVGGNPNPMLEVYRKGPRHSRRGIATLYGLLSWPRSCGA